MANAPSDSGSEPMLRILVEVGRVIEPLADAAEHGPGGLSSLLADAGIEDLADDETVADLFEPIQDIVSSLESVRAVTTQEDLSVDDVPGLVDNVGSIISGIKRLSEIPASDTVDDLGKRLLDYLLVRYLSHHRRNTLHLLVLADVVTEMSPPKIAFENVGPFLLDPVRVPARILGWGGEDPDEYFGVLITYYLHELAWSQGVPANLELPNPDTVAACFGEESFASLEGVESPADLEQQLTIPVLTLAQGGVPFDTGIKVLPLPGAHGKLPGMAVVPFGIVEENLTLDTGNGWTFNVDVSSTADIAFVTRPDSAELRPVKEGSLPATFFGEGSIRFNPSTDQDSAGERTILLGDTESNISLTTVSASLSINYSDGDLTIIVGLLTQMSLQVSPTDEFLTSVLPQEGLTTDFDFTVGWSSKTGLFFERGGTLDISLPQQKRIGPVVLREIYLSIVPPRDSQESGTGLTPSVHLVGAASATVELGPVEGTIKRMGVSADVSFPENADGNLGPVDLDMGFKPPEGIGIDIDAEAVTGDGYLEFEPEHERYAGKLQLHVGEDLVLNAVGLLTTRLPDGSDGFSLLVIIAGEFTPIDLGLGFTLNGVGGLLGVNRSFSVDPLRNAVRTGSLDSVLFPTDPEANAQRIISDLREIFPPTPDVHVFGPMVKLGWGKPTIITADLGVLLEIPSFKLAVLGRVRTVLPDEEAELIKLNMDVVGVFDPPGKRASIDASLYDSRVVGFTVEGDMALRSSWGENPRFVLSVGGSHPAFQPPGDFPSLRRARIALGPPGGNPSLELKGYFALTSNTAQVGADLRLRAKAGPASVDGQLGFDALFQFDPFKFLVDFRALLSVRVFGEGFSITIDGALSGPAPYRVRGRIHIDLWLIEVSANINVTLGPTDEQESLPAARVLPQLANALSQPANWSAQRPGRNATVATFREIDSTSEEVLVHPLGRIAVRQSIVPLNLTIEKFGNATPGDYTRFAITDVSLEGGGELVRGDPTSEQFAPAQFLALTDAEKLECPAFERHEAGLELSTSNVTVGAGEREATLTYETSIVDRENDEWGTALADILKHVSSEGFDYRTALFGMPATTSTVLSAVGAVAQADTRTTGNSRYRQPLADGSESTTDEANEEPTVDWTTNTMTGRFVLQDESYLIVERQTMRQVRLTTTPDHDEMTKTEATRALSRHLASHPSDSGRYQVVESSRAQRQTEATPAGGT